jgi:hypothetical protein
MKTLAAGLAMLVGGSAYLLWREESLLMFKWFSDVGMSPTIESLRSAALPLRSSLPGWSLYSLPEALWLLSGLLLLDVVWGIDKRHGYLFWTLCLATMAVGSELGQLLDIVPGRFDPIDLLLMLLSCVIAGFVAAVSVRSGKKGLLLWSST